MKYLKSFEQSSIFWLINVGDYVLCDEENKHDRKLAPLLNFISTHIGKYVHYFEYEHIYKYAIQYENVPEELEKYFIQDSEYLKVDYCRRFSRDEILLWDKSKEELELKIQARKYNI